MTDMIDATVLWYQAMPAAGRGLVTLAVGLAAAWLAFRIAARIVKGAVRCAIAAVLAFLLTTVPGNMLMTWAWERVVQSPALPL